jgi:hypothetical protein
MSVLTAKDIQKYSKYSVAQLKLKAQTAFNAWIRKRDEGQSCISCGTGSPNQAGHFYSAGHYSALRFNEDNCHFQCVRCNYFLSGNLNQYRINLEKKIGKDRLQALDDLASQSKRNRGFKFDRFALIEIILKYK